MSDLNKSVFETFHLALDNKSTMKFSGNFISEASWYDDSTQAITRQRIYETDAGAQVYSISEADGNMRSQRAYSLEVQNSILHISDGKEELEVNQDLFLFFVRDLLDMAGASSDCTMEHIEELLKAANC